MDNPIVFVCYDDRTAKEKAKALKECLEQPPLGIKTFVAASRFQTFPGKDQEESRYTAIKKCKYFIFIVTSLSLTREEVIKEVKTAL